MPAMAASYHLALEESLGWEVRHVVADSWCQRNVGYFVLVHPPVDTCPFISELALSDLKQALSDLKQALASRAVSLIVS